MRLLLDADFLVYRSAFQKGKEFIQMLDGLDWCIDDIIRQTDAESHRIFLTGSENFRKVIAEDYKSNRPKERPPYYQDIRDYLVRNWNAEVSDGCEADDLCAMNQTEDSIVAGEDKDLLTIPGWHYRIAKKWSDNKKIYVSEYDAKRFFYTQCLTGDKSDAVEGLKNPAKLHHKNPPNFTEDSAAPLLEGKTVEEMKAIVQDLYRTVYGEEWFVKFDTTCRLLWLKRSPTSEYYDA